jgi:hypothetical protein
MDSCAVPKSRLITAAHAPRDTHSPRHEREKPKIGKTPITFTEPAALIASKFAAKLGN